MLQLICSTVNTLLLPFAASEGKKSTPLHTNLRLQTHSLLFPAAGASSMISGLERVLGLLHEHLPLRRNGSGSDVVVTAEDIGFLEGVEHILTAVQGVVAFDALVAPHPLGTLHVRCCMLIAAQTVVCGAERWRKCRRWRWTW